MDAVSITNWVLLGIGFLLTALTDPGLRTKATTVVDP